MASIGFHRRHNFEPPASYVLLITLVAAGLTHYVFSGSVRDAGTITFSLVTFEMTAALFLALACASTLVVQALQPRLNRTPILPGVVLLYATWVAWRVLHAPLPSAFWHFREGAMAGINVTFSYVLPVIAILTIATSLVVLLQRKPLSLRAYGFGQLYRADPEVVQQRRPPRTVAKAVPTKPQSKAEPDAPKYKFPATPPKVTFADLYGNDELKARLLEIGDQWTNEGKNGLLLFGPPGTGKTVFAEALAGQLGIGFIKATFGDMASKWINQSTEQLVLAFSEAHAQQPAMLFIDEVDSLLRSRDSVGNYEEYERMVTTFLDKVVDARGGRVLVVAATNYVDRLDDAAIREGRFDFKIEVPLPDAAARRGLLTSRLDAMHCVTDDDTMARLTRRWGGFSVPRLNECAEGAAKLARAAVGRPEIPEAEEAPEAVAVEYDHFYRALRKIQGRKGGAPEGAKQLSEMFLDAEPADRLASLATQLVDVDKVERMGGSIPKGVLFYGPPGTGKTATAMALARECGWSFISRTGRELLDAGAVDRLGKEASDLRPAIVFIDEADDILGDRRMSGVKSATNELLILIDGAGGMLQDVVWVAATNHPDSMDSAARRGGRFGQKIAFGPPSEKTAIRLIVDWVRRKQADKAVKISGSPEQWSAMAFQAMRGLTPSDLYQVLEAANNAAITANLRKHTARVVTVEHIRQAVAELKG